MKKYILDLTVSSVEYVSEKHVLIRLTHVEPLPEMLPGQFVEVRVDGSPTTFLRRPVSINYVDRERNELWLLVAMVGDGTRQLGLLKAGDTLNCVLPLGNGFTSHFFDQGQSDFVDYSPLTSHPSPLTSLTEVKATSSITHLLIGGGVGVAPLLYLGATLKEQGVEPTFLLGGKTKADLLELDFFNRFGRVMITTEDGSMGEQGFVTNHSVLQQHFDHIYTCGPTPMMKAVARYAKEKDIDCEASLENMMACGVGACLCCVEKTTEGNLCVCKDGPVFNIHRLLW